MEKKGLYAFTLKLIAIITMVIDHTGVAIVYRMGRAQNNLIHYGFDNSWSAIYTIMRTIGRFAFPIFCFFIVEGFFHTRSKAKYALRLFLFALISEIPFDLALHGGTLFDFNYNNVYWTLLLGLISIWAFDYFRNTRTGILENEIVNSILRVAALLVPMGLAYILNTDYDIAGVCAIFMIYIFHQNKELALGSGILILGLASSYLEFFSLPLVALIHFYNGQQGPYNKAIKWGFYAFYPAHLLLLYCIALILGINTFILY